MTRSAPPTVQFALGFHQHQPYGNLGQVFEAAFEKSYAPLLAVLERHPQVRASLHYTGPLLEWLAAHQPEYLPRLRALVERGQIEILGGAMYEPILPAIPDADKVGQIRYQSQLSQELFGVTPRGMWLAERVWEPTLPAHLRAAGMEFTILDDAHFLGSGLRPEELTGYFLTEEQSSTIALFPIAKALRYAIPFQDPQVTIQYLRALARPGGGVLAVMADDGEKFGVWPGTYRLCYEQRWLDRFFTALEAEASWLELVTFSEYLDRTPPAGRVYIGTASYFEMGQWALPAPAARELEERVHELEASGRWEPFQRFVRGGFWRNFLAKYPEVNAFQKKMHYVSQKVHRLSAPPQEALLALWRAQTNCPYWHGVFGGVYLNFLRSEVYRNLIRAEAFVEPTSPWLAVRTFDLDADGQSEVLVESHTLNLYFRPHVGGMLFELDHRGVAFNLLDTLSRRYEAYHDRVRALASAQPESAAEVKTIHAGLGTKEAGLAQLLTYDGYERRAFIDHFWPPDTTLEAVRSALAVELGDFVAAPYEVSTSGAAVTLSRLGQLALPQGACPCQLVKEVQVDPQAQQLTVRYELVNRGRWPLEALFASEWGVGLLAGNTPDRYYLVNGQRAGPLASSAEDPSVRQLALRDEWLGLELAFQFPEPVRLWRHPIETVSQSEAGYERVYQSSVVFPVWRLALAPGARRIIQFAVLLRSRHQW